MSRVAAAIVEPSGRTRLFYMAITLMLMAMVIRGFWPSYFGLLVSGSVTRPWIVHVHGAVFSGWMLLLLAQASLVATGRVRLHRRVGSVGIAYGVLVLVIGLAVSFAAPVLHVRAGEWTLDRAAGFMLLPLVDMVLFAGFFGSAVLPGWRSDVRSSFHCSDRPGMSFHLRDATETDVRALATLHVQTFNETHRGGRAGGPSYETRERQWRDAFAANDGSWFCFVIEDDAGELIGFAKGTPYDGGVTGFSGELNKIYVLRRHHRQGLGRLLLCNVARRFLERDVTSMLLFGEASNPSNSFYERFGAERLFGDGGEFHGAYGWRDLHSLAARCAGRTNHEHKPVSELQGRLRSRVQAV